jgi:hypothetical protein
MTTPAEAALARNDAWLRDFVEALGLCPYARPCRAAGKLHRRVLLDRGGPRGSAAFEQAAQAAARAAFQIEALPAESVEVALLIFPNLDPALADGPEGADAFAQLCSALRDELARPRAGASGGGAPAFYCVAFHPGLPQDLADAHRAVAFIRRSPDPTLQLVRANLLEEVRGDQGSVFLDPGSLGPEVLLAADRPASVSERIARANLETLRREGADRIAALLASFRRT